MRYVATAIKFQIPTLPSLSTCKNNLVFLGTKLAIKMQVSDYDTLIHLDSEADSKCRTQQSLFIACGCVDANPEGFILRIVRRKETKVLRRYSVIPNK